MFIICWRTREKYQFRVVLFSPNGFAVSILFVIGVNVKDTDNYMLLKESSILGKSYVFKIHYLQELVLECNTYNDCSYSFTDES